MSFRLRESDCKIIECIAEYNILTVPQITAIFQKNKQVLRRRFRELKRQGLVNMTNREFGRTRGRPESLLGLTEHGLDILKEKGIIDRDVPYENVSPVSIRRVDHQILLNWFRVHLNQIERVLPRLSVRFLAYNSPFLPRQPDGRTIISDSSPIGRRNVREVRFTPDAVFATTDAVPEPFLVKIPLCAVREGSVSDKAVKNRMARYYTDTSSNRTIYSDTKVVPPIPPSDSKTNKNKTTNNNITHPPSPKESQTKLDKSYINKSKKVSDSVPVPPGKAMNREELRFLADIANRPLCCSLQRRHKVERS